MVNPLMLQLSKRCVPTHAVDVFFAGLGVPTTKPFRIVASFHDCTTVVSVSVHDCWSFLVPILQVAATERIDGVTVVAVT